MEPSPLTNPTPTEVQFHEIAGAPGRIQHPTLSREFPGRVRFLAYVSDESGDWQLYVQKFLVDGTDGLVRDGSAFTVETPGSFDNLANLFRKAQKKVERRHFRDRRALMYFEEERRKMQRQMGQDPYLDTPG